MFQDDEIEEYIPPIIERVQNIGGSAAAPGTGEFHKYKAQRRKEILAELMVEKAEKKKKIQEEFEKDKKEKQNLLDEKALKRKRKRDKKKIKKKIYENFEKNKNIFDKNIPLIEQIKNEMGNEEFNKAIANNENSFEKNKEIKDEFNNVELKPKKGEIKLQFIKVEKEKKAK